MYKGESMANYAYEIFHEVARQKSFVRAAEALLLTPSAISHSIAGLEHEDGSGESFNLIAYAIYPNSRTHEYDCVRFKGYYDVKHRTGTLHRD